MTGSHNSPTNEVDSQKETEFYDWCQKNNLDEYIEYNEPKYRLGRLRIGRISNEYTIQEIQDLVLYYPDIKDIILKSDK